MDKHLFGKALYSFNRASSFSWDAFHRPIIETWRG